MEDTQYKQKKNLEINLIFVKSPTYGQKIFLKN